MVSRATRRAGGVLGAFLALAVAAPVAAAEDVRSVGPDLNGGKLLPVHGFKVVPASARRARLVSKRAVTPPVGTVRRWPALDDLNGIYLKEYTLRAGGEHTEVWVANDITFPEGDCRNDGVRNVVTDEQAAYMASEFDTRMYPTESAVFSVPPDRDGTNDLIGSLPAGYFGGAGDDIVTLVDNVRDENYYDTDNAGNLTRIGGFFYSVFNDLVDRNVMSIDAYDWVHQTGATPPDDPAPGDLCLNAPARPYSYESTFAHEYQHLLESYVDPDEVSWVNEGLSDWAQTLTGYVDPRLPITSSDFDSHIQCLLGYLGVQTPANPNPRRGGPENSLTLWGDQTDHEAEVLCDYGAAYTFMEFLHGRYGTEIMTALHHEQANGLEGLKAALRSVGRSGNVQTVLRDWTATLALDSVIDSGARLFGRSRWQLQTPTLDASINWDETNAYSSPGAPPNGSDFVRLRDASGAYLNARQLRSLRFDGAETLEPEPVEWTVDPAPEGRPADASLYSGSGSNFDRSIIRAVTVPAAAPTLTFQTRWSTEELWDYGFVQVSKDGGASWTSLGNADTTEEHDPGAIPLVVANLPGLTGDSGGWKAETFDLSAYAGESVLLAFRYITDPGVDEPGWWIDDVRLGGALLSDGSSLDGWQTATQIRPLPVEGYTVQLVGYTSDSLSGRRRGVAFVRNLHADASNRFTLDGRKLRSALRGASSADVVAVLVMQDDLSETVARYARYTLTANDVVQPGG